MVGPTVQQMFQQMVGWLAGWIAPWPAGSWACPPWCCVAWPPCSGRPPAPAGCLSSPGGTRAGRRAASPPHSCCTSHWTGDQSCRWWYFHLAAPANDVSSQPNVSRCLTFMWARTSVCAVWTIVPASSTSILLTAHCSMLPLLPHLEGVFTPCPSLVPPPHRVAIWSPDHQTCRSSKSAISRGSFYEEFYNPLHLYLIPRILIMDILPVHL